MGQLLLIVVVAVTVAAVVFGVTVLVSGRDPGLSPAEPDGRALPLPTTRPLLEADLGDVRFDLATRGYRMAQVDQALRRAAYDIGYKDELIGVLEAEVNALREGRVLDADALRRAREAAQAPPPPAPAATEPGKPGWTEFTRPADSDEIADEPTAAVPAETAVAEPAPTESVDAPSAPVPAASDAADPAAEVAPDQAEPAAAEQDPKPAQAAATAVVSEPEPAAPAESAGPTVVSAPAATDSTAAIEPAAAAQSSGSEQASGVEPASATEPAAPAKARAPRKTPATRTSRPTKRAAAAAAEPNEAESPGVSPEGAPIRKSAIESETSEVAAPTEDAESARR
ncbi:DivIVA domain-containing protein [Asanoa ishikariensis]|uniref:DivIVA domain-containing protein n=1 Tax=Asanoa ishikariensis TaxID=137265 RepID=A0A1H3QKF2_9ACTN|nr:DivIVA domain-containing protein [Asanoa ishikariensis]